MPRPITLLVTAFLAQSSYAHEYLSLEQLQTAFRMDFDNAEIRTESVADGVYVFYGIGGNILASIGEQGVLLVDSQFPQMVPHIEAAIESLGGEAIDFTINTHWHFDHADGNPAMGRDGTWFVTHKNSRRMMAGANDIDLVNFVYRQPAYPGEAMPVITFDDHMQMHFNGHTIDLMHTGPAHTTGDTAVYLREANVLHMGDVYNAAGYPFIDAGNGGAILGMIEFCQAALDMIDDQTVVVPGHGSTGGYDDLAAYIAMLETVAARISGMIDRGMSMEEVVAAEPTAEFNADFGNPSSFINRAYTSLARSQ